MLDLVLCLITNPDAISIMSFVTPKILEEEVISHISKART